MNIQKYYDNMTAEQIRADILTKQNEIKKADKRTYNGRMTKIFNKAIIIEGNRKLKEF